VTDTLPHYDNPPVIEAVCGVLFRELSSMHAVHLGSFWQKLRDEYCQTREVAPLAPVIERFEGSSKPAFQFTDVPPLPRTWIMTKTENALVQIQRDRFLHNWKKVATEDKYPRYDEVIDLFKKRFSEFQDFVAEQQLGKIQPLQYEMTYINHIPKGDGWEELTDVGNVFPDFNRMPQDDRYLPCPDQLNLRTSFQLPSKQGRLHVVIRNAQKTDDSLPILLFELTARGIPEDSSLEAMWQWFDLAHEWIVNGFTDLTSSDVRKKIWKQIR